MNNKENMGSYQNIDKIDVLDDGSMTVALKNGREAIIEIIKLNDKFKAAIYRWFGPNYVEKKPKSILIELGKHDAYQECAKEALGWVDENPIEFIPIEEKEL